MYNLILPFLTAFLVTFLTTPLTIRLAKKYGLVDDPTKRPHPAHQHKEILPRAGGLPIFLGILITTLLFIPFDKHILGILIACILLLAVGLIDDFMVNFSPYPRLILQFIAAMIVVASGVGITFITNPLGGILRLDQFTIPINFLGEHNLVILADIFALFWLVFLMNMINWSKGVDGQMGGIVLVAGITIGLVSYKLFNQGDPNQLPISQLAFITTGVSLGFLIFNWYPAKILPGQSASTILGLMIATLSILSGAKVATALLVLLIPSVDFFYTVFRRLLNGKSPFLGDQKHLHHLLLKKGFNHRSISLFYIISCAILGLASTTLSSQGKLFTLIIISVITLGTILWIHYLVTRENLD